ncbi:MpaA1 family daptide-type RiPP [Microbacterium sp. WCS2018Hpa-23]|nr:MpaA1 family daptide-type RiPP [Microbacterium sp. WCS2018Hpa-23]
MIESAGPQLQFQELEAMDAPSWDSFYKGVLGALVLIGIGAAAAT